MSGDQQWFSKRPVAVRATQFHRRGDAGVTRMWWEGDGALGDPMRLCGQCGCALPDHGLVPTLEGHHIACPGDWIITGTAGERYPCKPQIFASIYESVDPEDVCSRCYVRQPADFRDAANWKCIGCGAPLLGALLSDVLSGEARS